jgi:hypothetical protein
MRHELEITLREEHGVTVVSDGGATARMLDLGDRPIERVVPGGDMEKLGIAVSDLKAIFTGVALTVAAKSGEIERVDPAPMTTKAVENLAAATMAAAQANGHTNGNGHAHPHLHDPPALRVAGVPDVTGWRAKPVDPELERLVTGQILWRLRRAGVTTIAEAQDFVSNEDYPARLSRFVGASVIKAVAKALKSRGRRALKAVAGRRRI